MTAINVCKSRWISSIVTFSIRRVGTFSRSLKSCSIAHSLLHHTSYQSHLRASAARLLWHSFVYFLSYCSKRLKLSKHFSYSNLLKIKHITKEYYEQENTFLHNLSRHGLPAPPISIMQAKFVNIIAHRKTTALTKTQTNLSV